MKKKSINLHVVLERVWAQEIRKTWLVGGKCRNW